jgi:hypothetical protein
MAMGSEEAVRQIIDGLTFPVDSYRFNCNNVAVKLAEKAPQNVFPYWKAIAELLESSNTYHRCSGINILPHLIPGDGGSQFRRLFDRYFSHLDDESVIPPCYVARNCPTIAFHLPELTQQVVQRLLAIEDTHHEPGRKELIKADIIMAMDALYDRLENKTEVLRFVEAQLDCGSPKTRKAAKAFLRKHDRS